ncbi:ankyrin repeat and SOCS box protein 12-like isoform X4 [Adelges cooleyi]|uniref:ankyrin repeat and SOCS box protein 12-like isoform X4 n=1 Tax=Adelges cooleyi TaxID=133065 RepID=UPI00217FEC22|nr:ankyrin repeat and SOCS box protein 12-like isoform X4 [Adelges cooleyi]
MLCEVEEICAAASSNGHLECLKYLHENGCPWNETTTLNAVSYGHLECLRYAIQNGCPYDTEKVEIALFEMYAEKK